MAATSGSGRAWDRVDHAHVGRRRGASGSRGRQGDGHAGRDDLRWRSEEGRRLNEESLHLLLESGDKRGAARVYDNLARAALYSSDLVGAKKLWSDGLRLLRERSDPRAIIETMVGLASVAVKLATVVEAFVFPDDALAVPAGTVEDGDGRDVVHSLDSAAAGQP